MKLSGTDYFHVDPRLTLTFAVLIVLILGGNGLVVWQFNTARTQIDRLTGANEQVMLVLQLQVNLLSFHRRLDDLSYSRNSHHLTTEAYALRRDLHNQTQQTRTALAHLPPESSVDPAFWLTLEAIEVTLPAQLEGITELAKSDDWAAVQLRLSNQLNPIETQAAILVNSVDQQAREELSQAGLKMRAVQRGILIIVPATAISTFFMAVFFGWSIARHVIELRFEERVNERTRLARDLHDTLLQSFHGVLLLFSAAKGMIRSRPDAAEEMLEKTIERARQAVNEGREAVQGLRSSTAAANDLARAIAMFGQGLGDDRTGQNCPELSVHVEGKSKDLHPLVRDEVYQIACECLRNAFRHAQAKRIEVDIRYDQRHFRLQILDNGKGVDPAVLSAGGRAGHHGLSGINERAELARGKLSVRSRLGSGTEIELTIPASMAYFKTAPARQIRLDR